MFLRVWQKWCSEGESFLQMVEWVGSVYLGVLPLTWWVKTDTDGYSFGSMGQKQSDINNRNEMNYLILRYPLFEKMGCSSSSDISSNFQIPLHLIKKLSDMSDVTHPLNVNKKYQSIIKLHPKKFTNSGYRKTNAYESYVTEGELKEKIKQFWETRTSGSAEVWKILKKAAQTQENKRIEELMIQNHIFMVNQSLQMCIDAKFKKYQIPVFCINPPLSYSPVRMSQKNLASNFDNAQTKVIIRCVKYPDNDLKIQKNLKSQIKSIKNIMMSERELSNCRVRLFYQGRELKDENYLGSYNYVEGTVIQAMIQKQE